MKNSLLIMACFSTLFAFGCSSVTVNYDYDAEADFSKYKNFAWMAPKVAVGDARSARGDNTLFYKRLRGAMDKQLGEKGYTINADDPHFVIVYHLGVEERVDVTNWGYSYGPYWGPWGSNVDVYHYQEGTLIVDFIDYETKQLIWRGTAQKALSSRPDPDRAEAIIADIVERMLRNFPPPE